MITDTSKNLSINHCRSKATECRALAAQTAVKSHRIMLEHIAQTWERIAADLE